MKNNIIINLKTYKQGKSVISLVKKIKKFYSNNEEKIGELILGVQASDIYPVAKELKNTKIKLFVEHVDFQRPGRNTGYIIPESVRKEGAEGSFLNHSEHKLDFKIIKKTVKRCREINLKTGVFVKNLREAKKIQRLKPDYLIIEPQELVAGKKSVSKEKPELIKNISKKTKMPFYVGAGIKNKKDVETAVSLGAKGIAISSAVTKSKNPEKKLKELII